MLPACFVKEKNPLLLLIIQTQLLSCPACSPVIIPSVLSRFIHPFHLNTWSRALSKTMWHVYITTLPIKCNNFPLFIVVSIDVVNNVSVHCCQTQEIMGLLCTGVKLQNYLYFNNIVTIISINYCVCLYSCLNHPSCKLHLFHTILYL